MIDNAHVQHFHNNCKKLANICRLFLVDLQKNV